MAELVSIARPYAKAAFVTAKADNKLSEWSVALKKCSCAVEDSAMKAALKNPSITKKQLCELLSVFATEKQVANFLNVLAEKKRLLLLPDISHLFEEKLAKESGYLALTVTSAFPMAEQKMKLIEEKLSKQLKSKLNIDFLINEKIMGGLVVRSADWVLDDSIKGKLKRLEAALQ